MENYIVIKMVDTHLVYRKVHENFVMNDFSTEITSATKKIFFLFVILFNEHLLLYLKSETFTIHKT